MEENPKDCYVLQTENVWKIKSYRTIGSSVDHVCKITKTIEYARLLNNYVPVTPVDPLNRNSGLVKPPRPSLRRRINLPLCSPFFYSVTISVVFVCSFPTFFNQIRECGIINPPTLGNEDDGHHRMTISQGSSQLLILLSLQSLLRPRVCTSPETGFHRTLIRKQRCLVLACSVISGMGSGPAA